MAPRKSTSSTKTAPIPPANASHPARHLIPAALAPGHPHSSSYHSFITSSFHPTNIPASTPPLKKRARTAAPALPELLEAPLEARVLHEKLLGWYDTVKESRAMPWRKDVEVEGMSRKERSQRAYEVWVSEIMLQQTQVSTVIDYWKRWMVKFPTVSALAEADQEAVNEVWKGLGYYSRASRLLAGAKTVMRDFNGIVPRTAEELLNVDGIGPYSAGAISSIASGQRSALVDGNVTRVYSRLTALHALATAKSTINFVWALADVLVPAQDASLEVGGFNKPGAWNQALMELGATVCTPKAPKCDECPLGEECLAYAEVRYASSRAPAVSKLAQVDIEDLCSLCSPVEDLDRSSHSVTIYPMAKERKKPREEETVVCVLEWESSEDLKQEKQVLLVKRPEKGLLAGLFEFPAVDVEPSSSGEPSNLAPSARHKAIQSLLSTLLTSPIAFSPSSTPAKDALPAVLTTPLPSVTHVYSHMIRTYQTTRLVLRSPSLPTLRPASSTSDSRASSGTPVQSLPGRGTWVRESEVAGANTGGAVGRIWEERERARKGLPSAATASGVAKGKGKAKAKEVGLSKGQTTLSFAKVVSTTSGGKAVKPKPKTRLTKDGYETGSDAEEEEVLVLDDERENEEEKPFVPSEVYKKRRIAVASDEEDE